MTVCVHACVQIPFVGMRAPWGCVSIETVTVTVGYEYEIAVAAPASVSHRDTPVVPRRLPGITVVLPVATLFTVSKVGS